MSIFESLLSSRRGGWRSAGLILMMALGLPLFAACGGDERGAGTGTGSLQECDPEDPDDPDCGEVLLALTDADGDFLSYGVNVVSLKLTRADGAEVETLPLATTVDFAKLVEVTELLSSATVPAGRYIGGRITLDYSTAAIFVERAGEAVEAVVRDATGETVTTMELEIRFQDRDLIVARATPALLTIDFDLAASHEVNLDVTPAVVTLEPFLIADIDRESSEDFRVRGPLGTVDEAGGSYTIVVRPFHARIGEFGRATVYTTGETLFEIDGVQYTGAAGLAALAAQPPATATLAIGTFDVATRRFTAVQVYAASSVPGGELDVVEGHVTARAGDVLTVRGATLIRAQASAVFHDEVTVVVGPDTRVIKAGAQGEALDDDAISVGQRLTVFGTLTDTTPGSLTLDATAGLARLERTNLGGTVVSRDGTTLVLDLQSIDLRRISLFDFSGTGATPADDADPSRYEVALGGLGGSLVSGAPVRVMGFVAPFGAAPPDFTAVTVVDFTSARTWLHVVWDADGTAAPFTTFDDSGLIVDLQNAELGRVHHLRRGAVFTDLLDLPASPLVAPASGDVGSYAIGEDGSVQVFVTYTAFREALQARLAEGGRVRALHAQGGYDAVTNTLTVRLIRVAMD
ncbi:MAG TPA: DUF4382 domain-containing protein [Gammaproteobacteria bacterium]|nr:DUF4382 domain-containing protein [Gammaproteobacteria bacterium]